VPKAQRIAVARHDKGAAIQPGFAHHCMIGYHRSGSEPRVHQFPKTDDMFELKTIALFLVTAFAEILGCYLPYLYLREGRSAWLLLPAAFSLALFAWLLSLHPTAAGRVYAAYGGVYVFVAILWLWAVDGIRPTLWDIVGSAVALTGMAIIMFSPRGA
jgi:small multidrug resistance family-3 protein